MPPPRWSGPRRGCERAGGFDAAAPTLVVFEAVLFYLSPPAARAALVDGALRAGLAPGSRVALTDSLVKLGVGPRGAPAPNEAAARAFFAEHGASLRRHDALWGGALHFAEVDIGVPDVAGAPAP